MSTVAAIVWMLCIICLCSFILHNCVVAVTPVI